MAKLAVGDQFHTAALKDIGGATVEFPGVFANDPANIVALAKAAVASAQGKDPPPSYPGK